MPQVQSRAWCFTLNNYTEGDVDSLLALADEGGPAGYILFAPEIGESGTPHLQGYIEVKSKKGLRTVRGYFKDCHPHLEPRRGTYEEATAYCRKGPGPISERGIPMRPGHRGDLEAIRARIASGATMQEVANDSFALYCQYGRAFYSYRTLVQSGRDFRTECVWIYGEAGTGKSAYALADARAYDQGGDPYYLSDMSGQWFDGYDGQRVCIFDDFNGTMPIGLLLRLLDRYPVRVPTKGGFSEWVPRRVYITSNVPPESLYSSAGAQKAALGRRIDTLREYRYLTGEEEKYGVCPVEGEIPPSLQWEVSEMHGVTRKHRECKPLEIHASERRAVLTLDHADPSWSFKYGNVGRGR